MNDAVCDSSSPALTGEQSAHTEDYEHVRRLAEDAIDAALAYYSGDVAIDTATFYRPVLDLVAENDLLRELLYQALTEGGIPPADYGVSLNHDTGQAFLLSGSRVQSHDEAAATRMAEAKGAHRGR